jgi:hypothetical protein
MAAASRSSMPNVFTIRLGVPVEPDVKKLSGASGLTGSSG